MAPSTPKETTFTPRDFELLAAALRSVKSELIIDYAKMSAHANLANSNSAKASWHTLKKKLDKMDKNAIVEPSLTVTAAGSPSGGEKAGKGSNKKRKIDEKLDESESDDEETIEVAAPTKGVSKKKGTATMTKKLGRKAPITSAKTARPAFPNLNLGDDDEEIAVAKSVKDEAGDESA